MISLFSKHFILRLLRSLWPRDQTPSHLGLYTHNTKGFYYGLGTCQTGTVDIPTLSIGKWVLEVPTQTGKLMAGRFQWKQFPGRGLTSPYSSSSRGMPGLALPALPQYGTRGQARWGSPARERPSMSAATSTVEARCIARALVPWRGLCSLAVMMSLVTMCFLFLGQTTPDSPGRAVIKP